MCRHGYPDHPEAATFLGIYLLASPSFSDFPIQYSLKMPFFDPEYVMACASRTIACGLVTIADIMIETTTA
jgi:hypothetical protein